MGQREQVAEWFERDIANHQMTVLKDDGVHRHLKFSAPGTWNQWFQIITWPGTLCYHGDMGCYVFSRVEDMFAFFRGASGKINPSYWSGKMDASDRSDGYDHFSPELFMNALVERVKGDIPEGAWRDQVLGDLKEEVSLDESEHDMRCAADDFKAEGDGETFKFSDLWEIRAREYTVRFLWCCYALVWSIAKYDEWKWQ